MSSIAQTAEAFGRAAGRTVGAIKTIRAPWAVLLAGALIAAAIVFASLTQRYQVSVAMGGLAARIDGLTGVVDACVAYKDTEDGRNTYRFDCTGSAQDR